MADYYDQPHPADIENPHRKHRPSPYHVPTDSEDFPSGLVTSPNLLDGLPRNRYRDGIADDPEPEEE